MKTEYDFSKGEQGKFFQPDATHHIPVYLDPDVEAAIRSLTEHTGQNMSQLINDWLRSNIELIHSVQPSPTP